MGKKANQNTAKKTEAKAQKANVLVFLKNSGLDWLFGGFGPSDADLVNGDIYAGKDGVEWLSFIIPYTRVDGASVPGLVWGISAPATGGVIIMRLLESGQVMAKIKAFPNGKALIEGHEEIVKVLLGRKDIRPWTAEDVAALL